jgi:hypothetical protein
MRLTTIAFALLFAACNTADSMTATPPDWDLGITTDGGFTGRGAGSVAIKSAGSVVEGTTLAGRCGGGTLTGAERDELQRLVAAARIEAWRDIPPPPRGADMIRYTLTLRRGNDTKSISWTGEDVAPLPGDAASLFETGWRIRTRVCT